MIAVVGNVAEYLARAAQETPARMAVIDGTRQVTYAALDGAVDALAAGMSAAGVGPGDRVALVLGNRAEFVEIYYATLRLGAVAVPINPGLTADEVEHCFSEITPTFAFVDRDTSATVVTISGPSVTVIPVETSAYRDLLAGGRKTNWSAPAPDPESLAVLLFTAGSTGRPKAAMLPHRSLISNTEQLLALANPPAMLPTDVVLGVLPLSHVYSLNSILGLAVAAGATVVLEARFDPKQSLQTMKTHGVTVIGGAPPIFVAWSQESDLADALSGVRLLISGASALPSALAEQFETITGKTIWEGYGLTECGPVVATTLTCGRPTPGSVGRPLPDVEVRYGEIYVRGSSLFLGYWPDRRDGPDEDGWFGTGDVAVLDENDDLHLVDRRKEVVIVSGFNVYPREVERIISEIPGVREVAVIGVDHPYTGEAVKAFVSAVEGAGVAAADVVEACQRRLARFKCPTIVEVMSELPHSGAGKIARGTLRDLSRSN